VDQGPGLGSAVLDGHTQGVVDRRGSLRRVDGPADQFAGEGVLKGLDVVEAAQWPDTFDGGFRLSGHGDEVEVFYSLDAEYAPGHPNAPHERIAAVMLGAIADVLLAAGFGFTAPSDDNITDTNRRGPVLLVHNDSTEGSVRAPQPVQPGTHPAPRQMQDDPGTAPGTVADAALDDKLDDEDYPAYSMGRAAEILGVTPGFLRGLDAAKLFVPQRSAGGHRRYSRYQLRLAHRARDLVDQGTALDAACRTIKTSSPKPSASTPNSSNGPGRFRVCE
jgi:hypothetical protein